MNKSRGDITNISAEKASLLGIIDDVAAHAFVNSTLAVVTVVLWC